MINNIEHIISLLEFQSDDDFYYLQVLKRKKENPDLGSNSYLVKSYQINSVEYLNRKMPEIINLCEFHNARAYFNLNRRSFRKIALEVGVKHAHQMKNQDYYSVRKIYDSVCGTSEGMNQKNRRWVVDIDTKDTNFLHEVLTFINEIEPTTEDRIQTVLDTPNGYHIISHGFNSKVFKDEYPEIDIQKNNPSVLYVS